MRKKTLLKILNSTMMAVLMVMLNSNIAYAADSVITAELGDSYTIGAGYYDNATTINVPTLASQTPGTATAAQILKGKTAWVNGEEITGTIESKAAATYNVSTSNQTIAANQYLSGAQTIRGVTTANISAGNIKSGVVVKVGDSADDDRIKGVTGTFTSANTVSSGQTAAAAAQILSGYSAWVDGAEVKGNIGNASVSGAAQTDGSFKYSIAASKYTGSGSSGTIAKLTPTYTTGSSQSKLISGGKVTLPANTYNKSEIVITGASMTGKYAVSGAGTAGASGKPETDTSKLYWDMGVNNMNRYVSIPKSTASATSLNAGDSATIPVGYVSSAITVSAKKPTAKYDVSGTGTAGASGKPETDTSKLYWDMGETSMNRYVSIPKSTASATSLNPGSSASIPVGYVSSAITVSAKSNSATYTISSSGTKGASGNSVTTDTSKMYWDMGTTNLNRYVLMTHKAATTYNTSTSDQTISANQFLSGVQTIKAVTTSGISAANIKTGQVVKVGDANSATRIANITGTFTGDGTQTSGQTIAAAAQIRKGYSAWAKGAEVKGSIEDLATTTYNTSTSDQTIAAGKYIAGKQTIKAVTTSGISAANIKTGQVVKVGDANSATRIANVTGTFTGDGTQTSGQTIAAAAQIRKGYSAWAKGAEVKGSIEDLAATTYNTSTSDQTIAAGKYIAGKQTIKAVTTSGISAANIKYNQVVKVGDANNATRITTVTGTFTGSSTVSSGQTAAAAAQILSGYSAWVDGKEVKGSIGNASVSGAAQTDGTYKYSIAASKYTGSGSSGVITKLTPVYSTGSSKNSLQAGGTVTLPADTYNKDEVVITAASLSSQTSATATADKILRGETAYVNGTKITGTLIDRGSASIVLTSSNKTQTLPAGYYSGITVSTNVVESNIGTVSYQIGHHHVGTSGTTSPNGCYTKAETRNEQIGSNPPQKAYADYLYGDWQSGDATYHCNECGDTFKGTNGVHYHGGGAIYGNVTRYYLDCGYEEGEYVRDSATVPTAENEKILSATITYK